MTIRQRIALIAGAYALLGTAAAWAWGALEPLPPSVIARQSGGQAAARIMLGVMAFPVLVIAVFLAVVGTISLAMMLLMDVRGIGRLARWWHRKVILTDRSGTLREGP